MSYTDVTYLFTESNFPAGELHIKMAEEHLLSLEGKDVCITLRGDDAMDLMKISMMVDILSTADVKGISLILPYLPYSRQDRHTAPGESFALQQFGKAINNMGFDKVFTTDVHSSVAHLISNLVVLSVSGVVDDIIRSIMNVSKVAPIQIVFPDAGARAKAAYYLTGLHIGLPVYYATKVRDPKTGQITHTECPPLLHDVPVLIIDDICDGGRTFVELAKVIKKQGHTDEVNLYVTHGIFSKPDVFNTFDKVYCSDSYFCQNTSDNLTVATH